MLVYGINGEQAFNLLRWRSQENNVKVRDLAAQLLAEVGTVTTASTALRTTFDHLFLTVHQRISADYAAS
jgi:ANTAR domain-containing protein